MFVGVEVDAWDLRVVRTWSMEQARGLLHPASFSAAAGCAVFPLTHDLRIRFFECTAAGAHGSASASREQRERPGRGAEPGSNSGSQGGMAGRVAVASAGSAIRFPPAHPHRVVRAVPAVWAVLWEGSVAQVARAVQPAQVADQRARPFGVFWVELPRPRSRAFSRLSKYSDASAACSVGVFLLWSNARHLSASALVTYVQPISCAHAKMRARTVFAGRASAWQAIGSVTVSQHELHVQVLKHFKGVAIIDIKLDAHIGNRHLPSDVRRVFLVCDND